MFFQILFMLVGMIYWVLSVLPLFTGEGLNLTYFGVGMAFIALARIEELERRINKK